MDMFQQDEYGESSGQSEDPNVDISITFDELVKDLIQEKRTYIRELNMIIKVTTVLCLMMCIQIVERKYLTFSFLFLYLPIP